jgi:hypothetical protein
MRGKRGEVGVPPGDDQLRFGMPVDEPSEVVGDRGQAPAAG